MLITYLFATLDRPLNAEPAASNQQQAECLTSFEMAQHKGERWTGRASFSHK
jgi:hypothetical protein